MFYIFLTLIFLIVIVWLAINSEYKEWNNGVCKKSCKPWKHFDNDSQGGRGYTDGQGNYCWISYNIDTNYEHNRI